MGTRFLKCLEALVVGTEEECGLLFRLPNQVGVCWGAWV